MNNRAKKIFIFQQRGWATTVGNFLAQKLYNQGMELGALTLKKSTHLLVQKQSTVKYSLIINNDDIVEHPENYLAGTTVNLADICHNLDIPSIWPLVQSLRTHVKSYKDKYYYGFLQNVSDENIIKYIGALYLCIQRVFKEFQPDLIITPNFVSLPHLMFYHYAKKRGVPMLGVTDSKIKSNYIFVYDYKDSSGPFHQRIDELNKQFVESPNREKARQYIYEFRENFKTPDALKKLNTQISFLKKIRHEIAPFYHILKWYLEPKENYLQTVGITPDYRPPLILLRDHYTHAYNKRFAEKFDYYPLEKIKQAIYFPLQFQPEATIDVAAPFFNNQLETARQVAMSLPDEFTLIVKEHPAMVGYRSASYFKKLARTVNIKLVDFRIPGQKILEKCTLVISPNSTTIAEAAFLKKPVIQLGNLGTTLKLPNTFKHSDLSTLADKIKEVLNIDLDTADYDRHLENYVAAAYDTGFSVDYISAWEKGDQSKLEDLWKIYEKEISHLLSI